MQGGDHLLSCRPDRQCAIKRKYLSHNRSTSNQDDLYDNHNHLLSEKYDTSNWISNKGKCYFLSLLLPVSFIFLS